MAKKKASKPLQKRVVATNNTSKSWEDITNKYDLFLRGPSSAYYTTKSGFYKSWKLSPKGCRFIGKSASLPQLYEPKDLANREFGGMYNVPPWDNNVPYKNHLCLKSNYDVNFVIVVTGICSPAFVYYKRTVPWYTENLGRGYITHYPELHRWTKEDCNLIDPNASDRQYMQFGSVVTLNQKFYALSLQGTLAVLEDVNSRIIITDVSSSRAVPSLSSRNFKDYLIESNGEIFLIFLIATKIVDNVEIYRLRLRQLTWKKVESLGCRAVFVGDSFCFIAYATKPGYKGNCVYFTNRGADDCWVYDIARGDISPVQPDKLMEED